MGYIHVILFLLPHAQCTLIICYRMRSACLQLVNVCLECAKNLFPHAQYYIRLQSTKYLAILFYRTLRILNTNLTQSTLTICYRMRSVRLQFVIACLEYANKEKHTLIFPFQLNQGKIYEKNEKIKKIYF
jgi:hypothetical protein